MNVNVYLPDALGEQAKASDLPLSRIFAMPSRLNCKGGVPW